MKRKTKSRKDNILKKEEFLNILKSELYYSVSERAVLDQLEYYSNYIDREISLGKTEEEVVGSLGDPRLLAKTIESAAKASGEAVDVFTDIPVNEGNSKSRNKGRKTAQGNAKREEDKSEENKGPFGRNVHVFNTGGLGCIVFIVLMFLILYILAVVIGGIFAILSPILIPVLIVACVLWIIKGIMD